MSRSHLRTVPITAYSVSHSMDAAVHAGPRITEGPKAMIDRPVSVSIPFDTLVRMIGTALGATSYVRDGDTLRVVPTPNADEMAKVLREALIVSRDANPVYHTGTTRLWAVISELVHELEAQP